MTHKKHSFCAIRSPDEVLTAGSSGTDENENSKRSTQRRVNAEVQPEDRWNIGEASVIDSVPCEAGGCLFLQHRRFIEFRASLVISCKLRGTSPSYERVTSCRAGDWLAASTSTGWTRYRSMTTNPSTATNPTARQTRRPTATHDRTMWPAKLQSLTRTNPFGCYCWSQFERRLAC